MFFLVGGVQPRTMRLSDQPRSCPNCSRPEMYLKRVDTYISLFFIPLIPIKRGTPFYTCEYCNVIVEDSSGGFTTNHHYNPPTCRSCGKSMDEQFTYCPFCGSKQ